MDEPREKKRVCPNTKSALCQLMFSSFIKNHGKRLAVSQKNATFAKTKGNVNART
jgi:hypothetical protein